MSKPGHSEGFRQTVATRRKRQESMTKRLESKYKNRGPGWKADALDLYLAGVHVRELCEHYEIKSQSALYRFIATEALLRLMEAHHVQRLDEVKALEKDIEDTSS